MQVIRATAVPRIAGVSALAIALLILGDWSTGARWLAPLLRGTPHMVPFTALGIAVASVGILATSARGAAMRRVGMGLGGLVALFGAILWAGAVWQVEFGFERALWRLLAARHVDAVPGLPSAATSVELILVGLGLLAIDREPRKGPVPADVLGAITGIVAYVALVAYVAGASEWYLESAASRMALPTAIAFGLLALGLMTARPERGFFRRVLGEDSGGMLLRRFLPAALVFPPLLAALRIMGEELGLFNVQVGIAIMTLGVAALSLPMILLMARDLTLLDAKIQEEGEAVRKNEALLRAIVDNTTDAVFLKDTAGRYQLINRFGGAMLDRSPEEIIGLTDRELFPEETARLIRFHDLSVIEAGEAYTYEEDLQMPSGDRRTFLAVKAPYRVDGKVAGLVGISRDITGRKHAERDLKASEARFRALLEAAPDGVLVVDAADRIVLANPQAERMHGYGRHELSGRSLEELIPPEDREEFRKNRQEQVEAAMRGERLEFRKETQELHRDGTRLEAEISASTLRAGDQVVTLVIIRDVTERNRLRAEMARHETEVQAAHEASRLKDAFLSSLSHEIKTPLSIVMGYSELLQDQYPDDPNVEGMLDGTRRLIRHVQDLLDYAALVGESLPLFMSEACLPEIIVDSLATIEPELTRRGQVVRLDLDQEAPCIQGDSRRLGQVVRILLDNASRFSPEGASIDVRLSRQDDKLELEVSDQGIGMTEEELQRAFLPFGQVKIGDATRTGGLGLGLKIARALVDLHGGALTILSKPSQGTRALAAFPFGAKLESRSARPERRKRQRNQ